jgi:hypothetical protein
VAIFTFLIGLQFVVVATHDLLDIPGWTHGAQVRSVIGRRRLWLATAINSVFPGVAAGFAIWFWNRPKPGFVTDYWVIYCALTLGSAIVMWYVPYFLGANEASKRDYARMYTGTRHVLPARGVIRARTYCTCAFTSCSRSISCWCCGCAAAPD